MGSNLFLSLQPQPKQWLILVNVERSSNCRLIQKKLSLVKDTLQHGMPALMNQSVDLPINISINIAKMGFTPICMSTKKSNHVKEIAKLDTLVLLQKV